MRISDWSSDVCSSDLANFIWEHFQEKDNRSRTGKQLCHRDDGPDTVGSTPVVTDPNNPYASVIRQGLFSTGCKAGSLYDEGAFGTPNGLALAAVSALIRLNNTYSLGRDADGNYVGLLNPEDPYGGMTQSRDLREIASFRDSRYRAKADVLELNADLHLDRKRKRWNSSH